MSEPLNKSSNVIPSLKEILSKSVKGSKLVQYYKDYNSFNDKNRVILSDLIVEFFINSGIKMKTIDCLKLSKEILRMFPTELEVSILIYYSSDYLFLKSCPLYTLMMEKSKK